MQRRWAGLAVSALVVAACSGADRSATATRSDSGDPLSSATTIETSTESPNTVPPGTGPSEPGKGDGETGTLAWSPCTDQPLPGIEFECATLEVPLDHAVPDREKIDIAVARVATADSDARIGSLVFNPGGPGGSGVEYLAQAAFTMPTKVTQRFDLVGFDPRGVGASTAVECDNDFDDQITLLAAGDDAGWQRLLDDDATRMATCTAETERIGASVGTNNAARDLELLRVALGDDGLSYVGYSYGTRLGATYAELFPQSVRALVLDAAVKPTTDSTELDIEQAGGFDRALENFAAACDADTDCLLQELGPTLEVLAGVRTELAEVGEFPTDLPGRVLLPGELDLGVAAALYSKESWPFLAEAIYLAETSQDGSLFQVLADLILGRQPEGGYNNSQIANGFINCADDPERPAADQVRADADSVAAATTYFADLLRASTGCIGIPAPIDPLIIGPAVGAAPILVLGNTGDPATPYEWSQELAESLDSGVLFTVEAEGHTAFGSIECVADPVSDYLIDLVVPADGATCSDNATADFFVPPDETEIGRLIVALDCLRENGVDLPEIGTAEILSDPSGGFLIDVLSPSNPDTGPAFAACAGELADVAGG